MDYGVDLSGAAVTAALESLWAIPVFPMIAAAVLALRLFPQIWRAIRSLVARR